MPLTDNHEPTPRNIRDFFFFPFSLLLSYWRGSRWHKVVSLFIIFCFVIIGTMYGIAVWYQHTQKGKPTVLGVTFIGEYADYLGIDKREALDAILKDLGVKHLRLVSYWNQIEPTEGQYNFSELDYQMSEAEKYGAKVSLAIGLRQPRWPECHPPAWVDTSRPVSQWQPQLERYMTAVINRYKHSPALESYQLENEFFNSFGGCKNFDRSRLVSEFNLVKKLDPDHTVILSRSNNYAGLALGQPRPDIYGLSLYRRVWSPWVNGYFTYPFPSWYYAFLAGAEKIFTGHDSVIHELQAEPWPKSGQSIKTATLAEQNQTFDVNRLKSTVKFAEQTGVKQIDLWGAEYWYYRMVAEHDPSVWQTARAIFR